MKGIITVCLSCLIPDSWYLGFIAFQRCMVAGTVVSAVMDVTKCQGSRGGSGKDVKSDWGLGSRSFLEGK